MVPRDEAEHARRGTLWRPFEAATSSPQHKARPNITSSSRGPYSVVSKLGTCHESFQETWAPAANMFYDDVVMANITSLDRRPYPLPWPTLLTVGDGYRYANNQTVPFLDGNKATEVRVPIFLPSSYLKLHKLTYLPRYMYLVGKENLISRQNKANPGSPFRTRKASWRARILPLARLIPVKEVCGNCHRLIGQCGRSCRSTWAVSASSQRKPLV
ncbi:hypothetical protein V8C37DRAFT_371453 [Trichoderma ceciliae]